MFSYNFDDVYICFSGRVTSKLFIEAQLIFRRVDGIVPMFVSFGRLKAYMVMTILACKNCVDGCVIVNKQQENTQRLNHSVDAVPLRTLLMVL